MSTPQHPLRSEEQSVAAILASLGYTLAAMGYGFLAAVPPVEAVGRIVSSAAARGRCRTPTPRPTTSYPASTSSWGSAAPWWRCCGPASPPCRTRAPSPCNTTYRWCRRSVALSPDPSGCSTWTALAGRRRAAQPLRQGMQNMEGPRLGIAPTLDAAAVFFHAKPPAGLSVHRLVQTQEDRLVNWIYRWILDVQ